MIKRHFTLLVSIILIVSCDYDRDDRTGSNQQIPEDYESSETQFTIDDGGDDEPIVYFTGSSECISDGDYGPVEGLNILEDLVIPDDLPEEFDLSPLLPPIGNQGRQGSCVSWATTYYLKSFQEHLESGLPYDSNTLMSPAYTYNQITQGICEGTAFESTLNILIEKGAVSIESFPYLDYSCNIQPTQIQDAEAEPNKISDYKYLSGENMVLEMKTLINEQTPILIASVLSSEFGRTDEFGLTAYRPHAVDYDDNNGCHAMLIVGYSDDYNAFKVVNSWGEQWGDDGFIWIDYAAFDNVLDELAEFRVITRAIIVYDL